ncbi:MAG: cytochrome c oxidase subunit II [Gammaproteobacteria bacterium]|nr:cytochrome c oxidase subunit II [Gammaproteobacteria bacterium]
MAVAIVLLIIVIVSVLLSFFSPWKFTEIASNWGHIDNTVILTFWICGVVFALIGVFMVYTTWKFRYREDARADYEPENPKLEWWLTIVTTIGVVAMLAPGLIVWNDFVNPPDDAQEVEVLSKQWGWAFRFPGEDGRFGTVHVENIRSDNPFGMNKADPNGDDDVLVDGTTLHLPVDQPYKVLLRSNDVLHDFWVPEFRAKMDAVPGMVTYFWFTPTRIQEEPYEIVCAELCGQGHYTMRGRVKVDAEDDFQAWLASQPTWAQVQAGITPKAYSAEARRGRELWEDEGCSACHSLDGSGVIGPTWLNLWGSTRTMTDGTTATVDEAYVAESIREPGVKVVEGFSPVMIAYDEDTVTDDEIAALVALMKEEVEGASPAETTTP